MRQLILLFLFNFILLSNSKGQENVKTILAIFPHSDDQTAVGQVLLKYSKQAKVYIIYIVDDIDTSGLDITPAGDSINHEKIAEAKCYCNKLNFQPIFLGLGRLIFDPKKKAGEYFIKTNKLKQILQQKIEALKPDAIISYGPDGDNGHPEHRIVSGIITELVLSNGWVDRYPLFYMGWPKQKNLKEPPESAGEMDKKYLTVEIHYSAEDEAAAIEAFTCYKKEYSPQQMQEFKEQEVADQSNIFYFRQLTVSKKRKTDLFKK